MWVWKQVRVKCTDIETVLQSLTNQLDSSYLKCINLYANKLIHNGSNIYLSLYIYQCAWVFLNLWDSLVYAG